MQYRARTYVLHMLKVGQIDPNNTRGAVGYSNPMYALALYSLFRVKDPLLHPLRLSPLTYAHMAPLFGQLCRQR